MKPLTDEESRLMHYLNECMMKEEAYFEFFKEHGVPFIIVPLVSISHYEQMVKYREEVMSGTDLKLPEVKFIMEA